jgi:hypothetical protein
MIKTATDFNTTIEMLTEEKDPLTTSFDEKMDSDTYNTIFSDIETELDALYEKLRMLEDVKSYCREFVIKEIQDKKDQFTNKLKVIEDTSDKFQDTSCVTYMVPLESKEDIVRDRNGDSIAVMSVTNGRLEAPGTEGQAAVIDTLKRTSTFACYNSSAKELTQDNPGRSYYKMDEPAENGVTEDYVITFQKPINCNYINVSQVNCQIENFKATLADGNSEAVDPTDSYLAENKITGLTFTLRAKDFNISAIDIADGSGDNSFGKIDGNAYNRRGSELLIHDMVNETNDKNNTRYKNQFSADYATWKAAADEADSKNKLVKKVTG